MTNSVSPIARIKDNIALVDTGNYNPFSAIPNSVVNAGGAGVAITNGIDTERLLSDPNGSTFFGVNKFFALAIIALAVTYAVRR